MRVFKTKQFVRHAQHQRLSDSELFDAITRPAVPELELDLELGHGLVRQRILRSPSRRRRSYCTILSCRARDLGFVLYAFPRNGADDLTRREQMAYQEFALYLLNLADDEIALLVSKGELLEVRSS